MRGAEGAAETLRQSGPIPDEALENNLRKRNDALPMYRRSNPRLGAENLSGFKQRRRLRLTARLSPLFFYIFYRVYHIRNRR